MAEPTAISVILEPIGLIFSGLASVHWSWYLSRLGALLALPWKIALVPLAFAARILLVIFAPLIYILSFILLCTRAVFTFITSLEPVYTFFGTAAVLGMFAGLILATCSTLLNSYLGLHDDQVELVPIPKRKGFTRDDESDSSSHERDWQWQDTSPTRRKPVSGLLSQTIHEEDDSSADDTAL